MTERNTLNTGGGCGVGRFADRRNIIPLPYRGVSVQFYLGAMTRERIVDEFLGKEAYRRTEFIVLRGADGCAVIAVETQDPEPLFSPSRTSKFWPCRVHASMCARPDD